MGTMVTSDLNDRIIRQQGFADRLNELLDEMDYPPLIERGRPSRVGKDFGVTYQAANKWLTGESLPKTTRMMEMAEKYRACFQWLAFGDGPKRPGMQSRDDNMEFLMNLPDSLHQNQIEEFLRRARTRLTSEQRMALANILLSD